jgi:membrane associated rhomboid family serine protease
MGIYNRDYFREWNPSLLKLEGAPVVKYLLLANVAVFLLQIFFVRDPSPALLEELAQDEARPESVSDKKVQQILRATQKVSVIQEWFELDSHKVIHDGQVWRLVTHAFCHDRYWLFHIFINMLCLYWFGSTLEFMFGSREFFLFYLMAAIFGGLAYIGLDLYTGSQLPGVGASGAIMAVLMLYTMHFPRETICVCWFFPLEMRWLMIIFLIWDLHPILLTLSGDPFLTGIGHAAHLGGLAFGFLYAKFDWRLESIGSRIPFLGWQVKDRAQIAKPPSSRRGPFDQDASRLDDVLQKISQSGQDSLTDEERTILRNASQRLKNQLSGKTNEKGTETEEAKRERGQI